MDKASEKYKKYLIEIILNKEKSFFISGMNISNDEEDFLLIDKQCKIITFKSFYQIKKFIIEEKDLLDKDNFHNWIREIKDHKPYFTFDVDNIVQVIKTSEKLKDLHKDEFSQIVDLINIIGDYVYQVNLKDLVLLFEDKSIDLFKELFMDKYIWKAVADNNKSDIENFSERIPFSDFKIAFERLINLFNQQFSN